MKQELVNHIVAIAESQQKEYGPMQKVSYHAHYLAQEAANRLDYYRGNRGKNKEKSLDRLVRSVVSIMGEFTKHTQGLGDSDINKDFLIALDDTLRITKSYPKNLVDHAITNLVEYCDLPYEDKSRAPNFLLTAAAYAVKEYEAVML